MAELINLRRARKARARSEKEVQAAENRLRSGVPKAERTLSSATREKDERRLDGHRLAETDAARSRSDDDGKA